MRRDERTRLSRRLAYVLRHHPEQAGVTLDPDGWASVAQVVAGVPGLTRERLVEIVATDAKGRYSLDVDGDRVRAVQGHSAGVADQLHHTSVVPPPVLFHGTTRTNVEAILAEGLEAGRRSHVHLSADPETAATVGRRRGLEVVLQVDAAAAHAAGVEFFLAENGVWLVPGTVPARFLRLTG